MKRTALYLLAVLASATMAYAAATVKPGNLTRVDTSSAAGAVDTTLSSATHATYTAAGAFDGKMAADADRWLANKANNMVVTYHFNDATRVNTIRLYIPTTDTSETRAPKDWTFEGSNDGATWVVLDTRTEETGWTKREVRTYRFENDSSYAYYKFDCTAINGAADYLSLWEIEFYTSDASLPIEVSKGGAGSVTSSSTTYSSNEYAASKAFDNNRANSSGRWLAAKADNMYLVYHFKRATVVNGLSIFNGGGWEGAKRAPKDWTLSGSHDGETWTVVDTQSDETGWAFNSNTNLGEERYYSFGNTTAYEYYKFNCTALNGATDTLQIWEMEFYGVELPPPTLDELVAAFLAPKGYTNVLEVALDNTDDYKVWLSVESAGYADFATAATPNAKIAIVYQVTENGKWWFVQRMYYDKHDAEPYLLKFASNSAASYTDFEVFRLSDGGKQGATSPYNTGEYFVAICDLPDLLNHNELCGIFNNQAEFHMYVLHPNGRIAYGLKPVTAMPATLELGQSVPYSVIAYNQLNGELFPDIPVVYTANAHVSYVDGVVRAKATGSGSIKATITVGEETVDLTAKTTIPLPRTNSYQLVGTWTFDQIVDNSWWTTYNLNQAAGLGTSFNHYQTLVEIEYDNPTDASLGTSMSLEINGRNYVVASWENLAAGQHVEKSIAFADGIPEVTKLRSNCSPKLHLGRITVYQYIIGTLLIFH